MSTEPSPQSAAPERIGRYRVVRPLSKGGMALVYEGRRESLAGVSPRVAIKVILPDFANSTTFRDLFINEARLGAAMQHQNLVQIQDFDADGERYFIVMEYVEGLTLARMIGLAARHDVRIPLVVICEIGRQACDGLHYAHQAVDTQGRALGLVHRDVKPSNLIVNNQGGVKILDFGISKGTLRAEKAGSVKGTWGYMAPEQATGDRIGPTADTFALGIVLYEMAARRSMFKGREEEEIRRLLQDDHAARMASTLDAQYAPLVRVLIRSLQRDAAARHPTAADFGRALSELLPDPITAREETVRFYKQVWELHEAEKVHVQVAGSATSRVAPSAAYPSTVRSEAPPWWRSAATVGAGVVAFGSIAFLFWSVLHAGASGPDRGGDPQPTTTPGSASPPSSPPSSSAMPAQALGDGEVRPVPLEPERPAPVVRPRGAAEPAEEPVVDRVVVAGSRKAEPGADPAAAAPGLGKTEPVLQPRVEPGGGSTAPVLQPRVEPKVEPRVEPKVDPRVEPAATTQGFLTLSCRQDAKIYVDGVQVSAGTKKGFTPGRHTVSFVAPDGRRIQKSVEVEAGKEKRLVWDFDLFDFR
jgi:serine/threonine protein kinase